MNKKATLFKALKTFFFMAGFPLMLILMIITMAPMFDPEVTGSHAQNWIIVFTVIFIVLLIIHFLLERFIGEKSRTHHKVVLVVMSALSILCILLPTTLYDAVARPKYEAAQKQLVGEVDVRDYGAVQGWNRDFTKRYKSDVYALINENYDFCKLYGLEHTYSEWYKNADKENNLGYKYGSFEKAQKLVEEKLKAKEKLEAAQAELEAIEAAIAAKEEASKLADKALAADPNNAELKAAAKTAKDEYDKILAEKEKDLVRLKGQRVDISEYKGELVELILTVLNDRDNVLPDGLNIELVGINIPIVDVLNYILNDPTIGGMVGGFLNADMIGGLIPDVIYTGIGPETVSTFQKAVDGSDSDVSLAEAQKLDFMFTYYPAALASGAVKYISFIFVGIVVFCIFASDYFKNKQKEAEQELKEEGANND